MCFKSELSGLFVKHSAFTELIPAVIMLRAMGMESDQEIVGGRGNLGSSIVAYEKSP